MMKTMLLGPARPQTSNNSSGGICHLGLLAVDFDNLPHV